MSDIFISYAREDVGIAKDIADRLNAEGYEVWWDFRLRAGDDFRKRIQQELCNAKAVLVVWSKHSVESPFVCDEADEALQSNKLVGIRTAELTIREIPLGFRARHVVELGEFPLILEKLNELCLKSGRKSLSSETQSEEPHPEKFWWESILDMKFSDDDHIKGFKYYHRNNIRASLQWPGTWLTAYRSESPIPQCGVFMKCRHQQIDASRRLINNNSSFLKRNLPKETEFRLGSPDGILLITTKLNSEFVDDSEQKIWLESVIREYVKTFAYVYMLT